ncbi:probable helicase MAGATAMA 3 isoform X2 [Triticum aestivum]|uniref:probable helicase MAGATAMA 3 isoform X2 n=1 Tax=Triticum aestivum TaxID=4565 RepID=UPI001D032617|nr:probable helicase MAGATAMA 3 isoform X2 [Triticum aestivum]
MAGEKSGGSGPSSSSSSAASTMDRFHKIVLSWDYLRLVADAKGADQTKGLQRVKNSYASVAEYLGVFEPLLFEEVKAQIVRFSVSVGFLSNFLFCMLVRCEQRLGWTGREGWWDHVQSRRDSTRCPWPCSMPFGRLCQRMTFSCSPKTKTFVAGEIKNLNVANPVKSSRLERITSILSTSGSFLSILKICSLSTILREYSAMHSVASLPFKDLIFSASEKNKDGDDQNRAWNVPGPLMEYLKTNLNDSQLDAVNGPPGTGKTQTILGLLSAVLHSTPARMQTKGGFNVQKHGSELDTESKLANWMKASPWLIGANPRDLIMPVDGDDGFYPTGNELKPEVISSSRKYRAHVLVCAPSNSALDEIVLHVLQTGIRDENNNTYNPKIVRIGLKAHHSVKAVSMDHLIQQKLSGVDRSSDGRRSGAGEYDRIRASILDEAAIVFSTLSFSGSAILTRMTRAFDVVIIDEAAQAVEPATLVPLVHGCRQVFLVGDPVQLPATVISSTAQELGYGTSLFKRFQAAGFPVQMLKIQYRMHPEISIFPSKEFYEGILQDGEGLNKKRPWHSYSCFGPFCFFDIDEVESKPSGTGSWVNEDEVEFITLLYHQLATHYPELKSSSLVAVISPYKHQVKLLKDHFRSTFGDQSKEVIDVNTVDGFQGREKEVVIFSCVRCNKEQNIGFVSDFRRMNVAITRARSAVLVIGSASTLQQDKHWNNLVESAKERGRYFKVSKPFTMFFAEDKFKTMKVERLAPDTRFSQAIEAINEVVARQEVMDADDAGDQADGDDYDAMEADDGGGDD